MDVGRACCVMLCFVRIHKTSPHTNSDVQPAFVSFSRTDPRVCVMLCECVLLIVLSVSDIKLCERTKSKLFLLWTQSQDEGKHRDALVECRPRFENPSVRVSVQPEALYCMTSPTLSPSSYFTASLYLRVLKERGPSI